MLTVRAVILYSQLPHLNRGDWEAFERVVYSCVTGMPPTHVHTHSHSHARARTHTRTHCYPDGRARRPCATARVAIVALLSVSMSDVTTR